MHSIGIKQTPPNFISCLDRDIEVNIHINS